MTKMNNVVSLVTPTSRTYFLMHILQGVSIEHDFLGHEDQEVDAHEKKVRLGLLLK
jgi:hypothetical protein